MKDQFGREIDYLRISVTDLCNLRCQYCMPIEGIQKREHREILSIEEIEEIGIAAANCGIKKIRVTGGEPLVRRGIVEICRRLAKISGIRELCLTTNGNLLPKFAKELRDAGVSRLNISLDTLNAERYREITRVGELENVLRGIDAAETAGFSGIKINTVLIGGSNDGEIRDIAALAEKKDRHVRFLELMPIGECASWDRERFVDCSEVLRVLPGLVLEGIDGVEQRYRIPGWRGSIGLIRPVSAHFCPACNRIRVTSLGMLKPCLHSAEEIPLRGLHGKELEQAIREGIKGKPRRHHLEAGKSGSLREMNEIGG